MDTTLKIERIRAGFSQRQMSEELGIPLRTIENWDMGTRRPAPWLEILCTSGGYNGSIEQRCGSDS
ncbi:MAG: helix-turn-helix domain-containing protein [Lachnospiraceae bacterium]|nr:helix-turn-helix domain-containing protein [Lachnospiraceae bacterium]